MKKFILFLIMATLVATQAFALNVFTCEPEWKSLTEEISKDKADVYSATNATQDVHYIQAKPSLIAKIRKADMVVCSGADLEIGWLPLILRKAGSAKVQEGGANLIYAAQYVQTIEKPTRIDRADGDVHPNGNPHLHLNPYNVLKVGKVIADKLSEIDSENGAFYQKNFADFSAKMNSQIKTWEQKALALKGANVITNHKNMSYLFDWLKIKTIGTLEPKPGIPATSKHLSELKDITEQKRIAFIAYAPFESSKPAEWLSKESGIKAIVLPYTIGGNKETNNLFDLYQNSIDLMLNTTDK
ncbi:MAG: zinc ABC transporter substrate-binding protein [Alphaproteobacteria bacterium]|nr:zinc ABC transporter substrate-binding protein [Alphaproteobacteria bacterium]